MSWGLTDRPLPEIVDSVFRLGALGDFNQDDFRFNSIEWEYVVFVITAGVISVSLMNIFIGVMTTYFDEYQDRCVELFVRSRARKCLNYIIFRDFATTHWDWATHRCKRRWQRATEEPGDRLEARLWKGKSCAVDNTVMMTTEQDEGEMQLWACFRDGVVGENKSLRASLKSETARMLERHSRETLEALRRLPKDTTESLKQYVAQVQKAQRENQKLQTKNQELRQWKETVESLQRENQKILEENRELNRLLLQARENEARESRKAAELLREAKENEATQRKEVAELLLDAVSSMKATLGQQQRGEGAPPSHWRLRENTASAGANPAIDSAHAAAAPLPLPRRRLSATHLGPPAAAPVPPGASGACAPSP